MDEIGALAAHAPAADTGLAPPGSDFYYASLYLEPGVRQAVRTVEACRRAITDIPCSCSDRGVAHLKLAWWYEELGRLQAPAAPRHPLTQALASLAQVTPDLHAALLRLIEHCDANLHEPELPTRAAVLTAIEHVHGDILRFYLRSAGDEIPANEATLMAMACSVELAYELRGLRRHRRGGALYVSAERLSAHALRADDVRLAQRSSALGSLMQEELTQVARELHEAMCALPRKVRRRQVLPCALARMAERALQLTLADGCQVLEHRIELLPVHKLWFAWRTRYFG